MNTNSNESIQVYPIIKASREFFSLVIGFNEKGHPSRAEEASQECSKPSYLKQAFSQPLSSVEIPSQAPAEALNLGLSSASQSCRSFSDAFKSAEQAQMQMVLMGMSHTYPQQSELKPTWDDRKRSGSKGKELVLQCEIDSDNPATFFYYKLHPKASD